MVTLRPATAADLPAIHRIYSYAVIHGTASWEWEPPPLDEMQRRMQTILDAGFPYLVAETDEQVLGYAYASSYRPRAAYRWTCEDSIYIAPESQGKGVGRLLLADLLSRCASEGLRQMVAIIGAADPAPSIRLHTAMGFTPSGVVRNAGFKQGRWLDQVLMQRELGPGPTAPPD